ncbi:hypothetical protein [Nocardia cyriacigeorgica]|uniref:hypothetical protein n=1 Tax=Nocardia cyriacigeorgica TaxID=135487 RepID=UPI001032D660|nr:hypothetical protein [Nocardia cyriacigeorgica]
MNISDEEYRKIKRALRAKARAKREARELMELLGVELAGEELTRLARRAKRGGSEGSGRA